MALRYRYVDTAEGWLYLCVVIALSLRKVVGWAMTATMQAGPVAAAFTTRTQAPEEIFEYIEVFSNRMRLHSTLGYLSPEAFEEVREPKAS